MQSTRFEKFYMFLYRQRRFCIWLSTHIKKRLAKCAYRETRQRPGRLITNNIKNRDFSQGKIDKKKTPKCAYQVTPTEARRYINSGLTFPDFCVSVSSCRPSLWIFCHIVQQPKLFAPLWSYFASRFKIDCHAYLHLINLYYG